jgi:hypothetical protein
MVTTVAPEDAMFIETDADMDGISNENANVTLPLPVSVDMRTI